MKNYILFTVSLFLLSFHLIAQNSLIISLQDEKIDDFEAREFFFNSIVNKSNQRVFAHSKLNKSGALMEVKFESDLEDELKYLLLKSFPEKKDQIGLALIVEDLFATENYGSSKNGVKISFHAKIMVENTVLYTNRYQKVFPGVLDAEQYPSLIAETIQAYFYDFAMISESTEVNEKKIIQSDKNQLEEGDFFDQTSRNVVAIGYQIGGYTLIGIDYEIRLSDIFGAHIGVGYKGYTAGLKVHWNPSKDGAFVNLSYKDGGYGLINAFAAEYGSRQPFGQIKGSLGFHYQIGLAVVTGIDPDLNRILGSTAEPPYITMSLGIGFSW